MSNHHLPLPDKFRRAGLQYRKCHYQLHPWQMPSAVGSSRIITVRGRSGSSSGATGTQMENISCHRWSGASGNGCGARCRCRHCRRLSFCPRHSCRTAPNTLNYKTSNKGGEKEIKKFNGEAALLFRACFHIEGDWRPFEDGILWENEGTASPVESIK